ncbi:cyclopropane-fatty-acyl-phospholipid synthase [Auriscalpium vulgare]|uniref:Cyclopropane-fatty-acyl-phospholipid synthase n=1 Tax=Auriscalpium vulgare TaxID=40419 RepID=A0ACB8R8E9_9AGAM|nr:cyclopropane-fatty-acyl-phospholipid synthase [Auriscalpium vulgare]
MHPPTLRSSVLSSVLTQAGIPKILVDYARAHVIGVLSKGVLTGSLIVQEETRSHEFGTSAPGRRPVVVKVLNDIFWVRVVVSHDIGVTEAYMNGDIDISSLQDLFELWLDNRNSLSDLATIFSSLFSRFSALAINTLGRQSLKMAQSNVEVAYDTSNELFKCFLSKEMMYSCALWGKEESGVRGDITAGRKPGDLEAAQKRKIDHILRKARVKAGDRLLEIGSGWGGMALEAARRGCRVDTVTLSVEQLKTVQERAEAAGLSEFITVHLCDYRQLPDSFKHQFDALVSCEMFEAVGLKHWHEYFEMMDWALKKDGAAAVITATSQPEHRYSEYQPNDYGRQYNWPNAHLPSATALAVGIQAAVPGKFVLESIEDHGIHYPRTLREWGRRFQENFTGNVVVQLQEQYPKLRQKEHLLAFKRKWMLMFAYAEVGFARAYTSLICWSFARPVSSFSLHGQSVWMIERSAGERL